MGNVFRPYYKSNNFSRPILLITFEKDTILGSIKAETEKRSADGNGAPVTVGEKESSEIAKSNIPI